MLNVELNEENEKNEEASIGSPHRWAMEKTSDPIAAIVMRRNRDALELALTLEPEDLNTPIDVHHCEIAAHIGLARWEVEKYSIIGCVLGMLPSVKAFLLERPVLGYNHLRVIADAVFPLEDEFAIGQVDQAVNKWLQPRIDGQALRSHRALLAELKRVIAALQPELEPRDPKTQPKPKQPRKEGDFWIDERGEESSTVGVELNKADTEHLRKAVAAVADREKLSKGEALMSLIRGKAQANVTLHLYANVDSGMLWAERVGWLTPFLAEPWLSRVSDVVFETAKPAATKAYSPTKEQARYVRARDGQCRHPGCDVEAHKCEIDHIVPFSASGATDVDNLHLLCKRHHQLKTARYVSLLMGFSGVQAWGMPGTDEAVFTVPEGPLAQHYPMMSFQHLREAMRKQVEEFNQWAAEQEAGKQEATEATKATPNHSDGDNEEPPF